MLRCGKRSALLVCALCERTLVDGEVVEREATEDNFADIRFRVSNEAANR